jgi:hypothetical protein
LPEWDNPQALLARDSEFNSGGFRILDPVDRQLQNLPNQHAA